MTDIVDIKNLIYTDSNENICFFADIAIKLTAVYKQVPFFHLPGFS